LPGSGSLSSALPRRIGEAIEKAMRRYHVLKNPKRQFWSKETKGEKPNPGSTEVRPKGGKSSERTKEGGAGQEIGTKKTSRKLTVGERDRPTKGRSLANQEHERDSTIMTGKIQTKGATFFFQYSRKG